MKKIFASFYARITAVFLILLIIMGLAQLLISVQSSIGFVQQADQRMNANLAKSIALEFKPFLADTVDMPGIENMMHYLMVMNPYIEIYLLDSSGNIMTFFAVPAQKVKAESVSLQPIHKLLENPGGTSVWGDDPRNPGQTKPFSAAPMKLPDNSDGYIYVILGGEQYDLASNEIREGFLMTTAAKSLLISLLFTGLIGIIVFFLMTRRLRKVTQGVIAFKEGDYQSRLEEKSEDDFGQLSKAFNQMADTIVDNIEELKHNDDLRRELIANVSHDLRSPLASMLGYLETIKIKKDSLSPEELERYLDISLGNAQHLSRLISELFELSKLDAHQSKPEPEEFSVAELLQDIVVDFKPRYTNKSIEIKTDLDNNLPQVNADIGMIERAISNLLENAINYTPDKGKITITTKPTDTGLKVSISDTGRGIEAQDLPHIFSRYYRGKTRGSEYKSGTGLGLAIVRKILELHDTEIKVESTPDKGSTFYFELKSNPSFSQTHTAVE